MDKKEFKVGDKVCDIFRGNGVVSEILKDSSYPIKVTLNGLNEYYTPEGVFHQGHKLPSLFMSIK
jgi:adenine-specific DNA methylase